MLLNFSVRDLSVLALLVTVAQLVVPARAEGSLPACSLNVPVYDPKGAKLAFRIATVTPEGNDGIDLLTIQQKEYRVAVRGDTLYFQAGLIGKRRLTLVMQDESGKRITTHVSLMHCQQRMSVEYGVLSSLGTGDVAWSTVSGRLTGCNLAGDWWIRALPMFGGQGSQIIHEGFIRSSDGTFWIVSSVHGERHIIVVGKDRQPVKAFAFDVVEGARNDTGVIDLTGLCPK
jgi:hypothetical protein